MKKVLIIGAGFLQAFVIKRARDLGYLAYAVDGNPNAVGRIYADCFEAINIVDSEACLAFAKKHNVDGVLTAATDYGVLTASRIAAEMGLNGISQEAARLVKNKYLVRKCLFENDVDDTEQAFMVREDTDIDALAEKIRFPVMVKPCDGSGSRGAGRVDSAEALRAACEFAMDSSITHSATVETFIVGEEYGIESFVENGNVYVLAVMKKRMTAPPYYAELGHAIPSGLDSTVEEKVKKCAEKAINALGINFGSVNMDALVTADGKVHIVDIGARMGGNLIGSHIIPIGKGIDYMGNMIKAAVGDAADFTPNGGKTVATSLLALTSGVVKTLPDFEKIQREHGVIIEQHLHIGDKITPYRTNLDGCGYVVACGDEIEENIKKVEQVKALIDKAIVRE